MAVSLPVLGVSTDSLESHAKFSTKRSLPFLLLSDEDHKVCEKYGVWVEKNLYGKKSMGIQRATFVINRAGATTSFSCAFLFFP